MQPNSDIIIMGGGLAGLTLALQLRKMMPEVTITILDQRNQPAPERTFKVGESMVEVSSWYLSEVLGLRKHLLDYHLPKFGLRFFMSDGDNSDLSIRPEYGLMKIPKPISNLNMSIPGVHLTTFNVDRGRLENHLMQQCKDEGVKVLSGFKVKSVTIGKPHKLAIQSGKSPFDLYTRWVVDATGRAGLLARNLDLRCPQNHFVNAVWFRLNRQIDPEDFTNDLAFHKRTYPNMRWLSTNHFMGAGYWIWLIPLPDRATSVGIMVDPSMHSMDRINRYDNAMVWLRKREPSLAEAISSIDRLDYKTLKAQAYCSKRTLSFDRWALCGESAFFTDALYSPGGDFIAVGNTLITQIIMSDFSSDNVSKSTMIKFGEQLLQGMFKQYLGLYQGNYQLMGKPASMIQKVAWDTAVYFGYNVLLFRNGQLCNPLFHREIRKENARLGSLQQRMISQLKKYKEVRTSQRGRFFDQACIEPVHSLYLSTERPLSDTDLKTQLIANLDVLERFSNTIEKLVE